MKTIETTHLIEKIKEWLENEKQLGSANPDRVVLATASAVAKVHSRVVAICLNNKLE